MADRADFKYYHGAFYNIRPGAVMTDDYKWRDFDRLGQDRGRDLYYDRLDSVRLEDDAEYFVPSYLSGGDYSGSLVEMSNHRGFLEEFEDHPAVVPLYGSHGSYGVLIHIGDADEEIIEVLNSLEEYPMLDESLYSEMEIEAQNKAWGEWAESDFRNELSQLHPDLEDEIDDIDEVKLARLFWDAQEQANEHWVNEQSDSMHIDVDRVAEVVDLDDLKDAIGG